MREPSANELYAKSDNREASGRNFVLCPGKAYDRSPCGTGTSAKLACLAADDELGHSVVTVPLVRTMSAQVAARIREKILTGSYAPGAPLLQDSIAAELGVSKIPVREALVSLRAEGLVDLFAHRGLQVRPLSATEVEEVFQLRLQLEPEAVAHGARQALPKDRLTARESLDLLNETLAAKRLMEAGDLNRAFHLSLVVPRVQPVTFEMLTRLHTLSQRYIRIHLVPEGRIRRARREHEALYAAWLAPKSNEARRLTRRHIEETRDELAAALPSA